jgi:hypothetical protein
MQIRIYNPKSLELERILKGATSIQWVRRFFDAGNFEIHFPVGTRWTEDLKQGYIIEHDGKFGIIGYRKEVLDDICIQGYDLNGLAKRRCVVPPFVYKSENVEVVDGYDRVKGTKEEVLRHYVDAQMISSSDANRQIENLELGLLKGIDTDTQIAWQARFDNLKDVLYDICVYTKLGYSFDFVPSEKKIYFNVLEGVDRTAGQDKNPPAVFSRRYKSINSYEYTEDKIDLLNLCYVGGNGEEEQQFVQEFHYGLDNTEPSGINRFECFLEVSSDDGDELEDKGLSHLSEHACEAVINAEVSDRLAYKTDWNLGDFVTVKVEAFGTTVSEDKQITEVREIYEPCNYKIEPVFGEKMKGAV